MKILYEDYTFDASARQIKFNNVSSIKKEQLLLITNVTDNIVIYNFADPQVGGTVSGNILTLSYDTTQMSDSDNIQIYLDNLTTPASDETLQSLEDQTILLRRITKLLEPSSYQSSAGRQAVDVIGISAQPLVNQYLTYIGNGNHTTFTQESSFVLQSRIAYNSLRNKIDFT